MTTGSTADTLVARVARPIVRSRPMVPAAALAVGASVVIAAGVAVLGLHDGPALLADNTQQIVATLAALAAVLAAYRTGDAERRRVCGLIVVALVLAGSGQLVWDLQPGGSAAVSTAADILFALAVVVLLVGMTPSLFSGLERRDALVVALDAVIVFIASVTVIAVAWQASAGPTADPAELFGLVAAAALFSGAVAGFTGLLVRYVEPSVGGAWAVIAGVLIGGIAWISWLERSTQGGAAAVAAEDFLFSAGVLLVGLGGATWTTKSRRSPQYERIARTVGDSLPLLAMLVCIGLEMLPGKSEWTGLVTVLTAAVVLTAAARHLVLLSSERSARAAEQRAAAGLAREIQERADTIVSLSRLERGPTPEETARSICEAALRLDGIDTAVVRVFMPNGDVLPLAVEGLASLGVELANRPLPTARAETILAQAEHGPWVEVLQPNAGAHEAALYGAGVRGTANAPIRWGDRLIGAIGLGTYSKNAAAVLSTRLPTVREFGVVAAGLLGAPLAERERVTAVREAIREIIDGHLFRPLFQPVVELRTRRIVGYEALTEFWDRIRPDLRFGEAQAAGMGIALEAACLRAALRDSVRLPDDVWLSLNVSPALATALDPLVDVLADVTRPVILEITEHVRIEDYARLVAALAALRGDIRLAVDDAGAGYAGLRHILELRPHFVKLDIVLVRSLDTDPARRAMVGSMTMFARDTGCSLIAEGIETEGEMTALLALGVGFGQGYLLGRPSPA